MKVMGIDERVQTDANIVESLDRTGRFSRHQIEEVFRDSRLINGTLSYANGNEDLRTDLVGHDAREVAEILYQIGFADKALRVEQFTNGCRISWEPGTFLPWNNASSSKFHATLPEYLKTSKV